MSLQLWVVERPTSNQIMPRLVGEYYLRGFASIEAYLFFKGIEIHCFPHGIVINCNDFNKGNLAVIHRLSTKTAAPDGPTIIEVFDNKIVVDGKLSLPTLQPLKDLKKVLRDSLKPPSQAAPESQYGRYSLDTSTMQCQDKESKTSISLTQKELRLLEHFLSFPDKCISRDEMIGLLWAETHVTPRTLDCHISRLRKKIANIDLTIEPVYGDGYTLKMNL
jgi:hypothetical protein